MRPLMAHPFARCEHAPDNRVVIGLLMPYFDEISD
jgi:hypothetical protein